MKKNRKISQKLGFFLVLGCFGYFMFTHKIHDKPIQITQHQLHTNEIHPKIASVTHSTQQRSKKNHKSSIVEVAMSQPKNTISTQTLEKSGDDFNAGLGSTQLKEPTQSPEIGIRIGSLAPNYGITLDLTGLQIKVAGHDLATRFSLGAVKCNSEWKACLYLDELVYFPQSPDVTCYIGAGINLPLADGASLGYELLGGIEGKTTLFKNKNEKLFLECGLSTFSINDMSSDAHLTISAGYKFSL